MINRWINRLRSDPTTSDPNMNHEMNHESQKCKFKKLENRSMNFGRYSAAQFVNNRIDFFNHVKVNLVVSVFDSRSTPRNSII